MAGSEESHSYSGREHHVPVLCNEVIEFLSPVAGEVYIDATFGAGGHTLALLESADCRVVAIDRDPYAQLFADKITEKYSKRFTLLYGRFSRVEELVADLGIRNVDGVLFDLGVSSMQLDTPRRGFSFKNDGPLDMRMDDAGGVSAEDLVNSANEEELAGVIFKFGGERLSRRIAAAIVAARGRERIKRTSQLASIIRSAVGSYNDKIDPATRTFQALRIWANDEINELSLGLQAVERLLTPRGKLAVISFHSGEDKVVKDFLKERSGANLGMQSRYQPILSKVNTEPTFSLHVNKAIVPSEGEISNNPRSRSAKLRLAIRTGAPDWKGGMA